MVAIRGGTVLTVTKGTIQNGVVVLRDGKIAAVGGSGTDIPSGAEIVEAKGRFVTPGIIDAHSHIAAESINEGGTTVSSMTGIEDVLDPTDVAIQRDLAGGLTVANVLHGSANPIGGKNQVIKLRWGKDARGLIFEGAPPGIKFALGENPKDMRQFGQTGPRRYPVTRAGVEFVIRDAFSRAKAYQREWQDYERRRKAGEDVSMPRRDLQLEPLVEILDGKRLVHSHTYRADETLMLIRLAEEMGFKIATFQHILEGYKVADEMAKHGAGGSTFSDWWAYKVEAEDAIPHNAAIMHKRGVLVSINSDSAEHARRLNTEAAKSMHWGGLTEDEVFAVCHHQSREAVEDRPPRRLARGGQGRRRGDLEQAPAEHLRDCRPRLHRWPAVLRPPRRRAPADRCAQGEGHAGDGRRAIGAEHRATDAATAHGQRSKTQGHRRRRLLKRRKHQGHRRHR